MSFFFFFVSLINIFFIYHFSKIFQNKAIGKEINEQDAILDEIMYSVT